MTVSYERIALGLNVFRLRLRMEPFFMPSSIASNASPIVFLVGAVSVPFRTD
jgi:hypothetical protein